MDAADSSYICVSGPWDMSYLENLVNRREVGKVTQKFCVRVTLGS